jgi:starch phosphorylase
LTIGTLDGANVEMLEQIGAENMFIFGHTVEQVRQLKRDGYNPHDWCWGNPRIERLMRVLIDGRLAPEEPRIFQPIFDSLMYSDPYLNLGDLPAYLEAQERVSACYQDPAQWSSKAILNVARTALFSSDRTIRQYAENIWGVVPVPPSAR